MIYILFIRSLVLFIENKNLGEWLWISDINAHVADIITLNNLLSNMNGILIISWSIQIKLISQLFNSVKNLGKLIILLDIENYREWDTFIKSINGRINWGF